MKYHDSQPDAIIIEEKVMTARLLTLACPFECLEESEEPYTWTEAVPAGRKEVDCPNCEAHLNIT